ncbi:magnesium transporter NIPA-domain-containing protein [Geopyxis carbonaria]|nr:magnesium transporter NIPA-domain-containing protein [Geopyxis carbonaria]
MGLGDLTPGAQIGIGVTVGIISTSIQSLGLTLQRKSHLLEDDRPSNVDKRPPHQRRRWQIGMLLFIVSNILGSSIQITTLPLVILSPLQASGLVFNSICATLILSEPFTRYSLCGTVLVCIGATLIAAFGALKEPAHSLDELLALLGRKPFLLWMGGTIFMVLCILGGAKSSQVLIPRTKNTARMKMIRGIAYGCVSGILSAHCLLLAKSAVELLVRTVVDRVNQFNRWQSWVILLGLVSLALTQLYYLHRGLKLCSTSVLYPLVFCVYNIIAIMDGLLYYRQTSRLSTSSGCLIALGTAILLSGVLALSWRLSGEPTKPGNTASALTPGLGFVDSDSEVSETDSEYSEEGLSQPSLSYRKADADKILSITRRQRCALSQAEEIWEELQDDGNSSSPHTSRVLQSAVLDEEDIANEQTSLIGKHPTRRKTRRNSYGFPHFSNPQPQRSRPDLHNSIGGWFKMRWWNDRKVDDMHVNTP